MTATRASTAAPGELTAQANSATYHPQHPVFEETTYRDLAHQVGVLELCRELNSELGTSIVAVLHDLNQACRYADQILVMRGGMILTHSKPEEVITAAIVEQAFDLPVRIITDPLTHTPW